MEIKRLSNPHVKTATVAETEASGAAFARKLEGTGPAKAMEGGAAAPGVWVSLAAGDRVQVPGYNLLFVLLGGEVARPSWIATVTGTEKTVAALVVMALGVAAIFWRL